MQIRLRVFIIGLFGLRMLSAQSVTWSGATDEVLNTVSNWSGAPANADLIFGPTSRTSIDLNASLDVKSLTFSGAYPSYFFSSTTSAVLGVGAGGITVGAQTGSVVRFDPTLSLNLMTAQTWTTTRALTVEGGISSASATLLSKAGVEELTLNGDSTFSGGITVQQGRLSLGSSSLTSGSTLLSGAAGTGTITLMSGTTLGVGFPGATGPSSQIQVANDVILGSPGIGNNVTLSTALSSGNSQSLTLSGTITAGDAATTLHLAGEDAVELTGMFTGPASSHLVVDNPGSAHGGLIFAGTFSPNVLSVTADGAALFFFTPPPATVQAINHGYIGTAITAATVTAPLDPSVVLSRIAPADRASFAGTFGFDTDDRILTALNVVSENLDFSAFTHPDFRIGSMTGAVLTGMITPPISGSTSAYRFGGSSGYLLVKSNLTDVAGAPASLLLSTSANTQASHLVLLGNNTFTGSVTLDGISARMGVEHGIAVLDSPAALPIGAASQFTFGANSPAYIGYTEAAGFANFADFTSHLATGGYNPLSIFGLDSADFYTAKIAEGKNSTNFSPRQIAESIDLRSFGSVYLGSASHVVIDGTVFAPADGVLKLTAVGKGTLTIKSDFGANVTSLVVGIDGSASSDFGNGRVRLLGNNTFAGGTTLKSGVLVMGDNTNLSSGNAITSGPIGTGTLVIENGVTQATLAADADGTTVYNPILLNAPLRIGAPLPTTNGNLGPPDFHSITLAGAISGANQLEIFGTVNLQVANTYTGGTLVSGGQVNFDTASAFGPGNITLNGDNGGNTTGLSSALNASNSVVLNQSLSMGGHISFGSDSGTLELSGPVTLSQQADVVVTSPAGSVLISGPIGGASALHLDSGSLNLSGNNGYSGGTLVTAGSLLFLNASAVPASGAIQVGDGGYVGAGFTTNLQMGFLDRLDQTASVGTIGFDSTTPISEPIDLSNFNSAVRLGSSSQATLSGVITPSAAATSYNFGNGGGTLTVLGNLTGARSVDLKSDPLTPLTLVLSGNNTYSNGTTVETSVLRFDSATALPVVGLLDANNYGYIGYTENTGLTSAAFLAKFTATIGSNAIVGFDSASINSPRTTSEAIVLTGFNTTTYIGTSTAVTLSGPITPFGSVLNLTGVDGGSLVVDSIIASGSLTIGTPYQALSGNGTVTLNAANTFTGGTTLKYGHLILGNAAALGAGALTIDADGATLSTNAPGFTIPNNLRLSAPLATVTATTNADLKIDGSPGFTRSGRDAAFFRAILPTATVSTATSLSLILDATHDFTLSGLISGTGSLSKMGTGSVTLSGLNSVYSGLIQIYEGSMTFSADASAGTGGLGFLSSGGATANFLSSAPIIGDLSGYDPLDQVNLATGSTLTINPSSDNSFYGTISGNGAKLVLQSGATSNSSSLALYGNNSYTGGTNIGAGTTLVAANSGALGISGTVELNGGILGVKSGVTVSFSTPHPLLFNDGRLAGNGTLNFDSNLTVHSSVAGTGILAPGLDGRVGTLNFSFNAGSQLVLDSGGGYQWKLTDPTKAAGGWDSINVAGTVAITSTAAAPFDFTLSTLDAHGNNTALATFNLASTYSWTLLTATSIVGFDSTKFSLDSGHFLNPGSFSLTEDAAHTSLILNFSPSAVPEPSTWALLIAGLGIIAVLSLQRRKSA